MRRIFALLLVTVFFLNIAVVQSSAISAHSAVLMDAVSGRILFSRNSNLRMGMASTTKIMTAITALENGVLNSVATISPNAYGVEGSSMYLGLGEKLTLEELLWGLMLVSGNDAATAVAEHISGSVDKFAALMNTTAEKIGVKNTNFTNPHGLTDENHYTTAQDLAKITSYALENPKFREIVSTRTKNIPWENHDYDRHLVNHNKLLSMYEGCIGVKTGFTKATGRCLVTAVERNGMRLVCVTLNAPDDWNDHMAIYDNAFAEYSPYTVVTANKTLATAKVRNGYTDSVPLAAVQDICIPIKNGEDSEIQTEVVPFEDLQAPIKKGDTIGTLSVEISGTSCGKFPLVAAEDVELKKMIFKARSGTLSNSFKKVFLAWLTCFF